MEGDIRELSGVMETFCALILFPKKLIKKTVLIVEHFTVCKFYLNQIIFKKNILESIGGKVTKYGRK